MFQLTSINIESLLASLSSDQLNDLAKSVDKHEAQGLIDTVIKSYSKFVQEMSKLKDTWQTMNEQYFQKSLLKPRGRTFKSHF